MTDTFVGVLMSPGLAIGPLLGRPTLSVLAPPPSPVGRAEEIRIVTDTAIRKSYGPIIRSLAAVSICLIIVGLIVGIVLRRRPKTDARLVSHGHSSPLAPAMT
jgi:hypothetical protein